MYICTSCLNRKKFHREGYENGTSNYSCYVEQSLDGNGDVINDDRMDYEYDEEEATEFDAEVFNCGLCGSDQIMSYKNKEELRTELSKLNLWDKYQKLIEEELNGGV